MILNRTLTKQTEKWFDTVYSGPYLVFSAAVLPTFTWSDWCENDTSFWKRIEVWLNVFFNVIDISMETIKQKYQNRLSMKFVRTRSVIAKLMPISETTMYGKGNVRE